MTSPHLAAIAAQRFQSGPCATPRPFQLSASQVAKARRHSHSAARQLASDAWPLLRRPRWRVLACLCAPGRAWSHTYLSAGPFGARRCSHCDAATR